MHVHGRKKRENNRLEIEWRIEKEGEQKGDAWAAWRVIWANDVCLACLSASWVTVYNLWGSRQAQQVASLAPYNPSFPQPIFFSFFPSPPLALICFQPSLISLHHHHLSSAFCPRHPVDYFNHHLDFPYVWEVRQKRKWNTGFKLNNNDFFFAPFFITTHDELNQCLSAPCLPFFFIQKC